MLRRSGNVQAAKREPPADIDGLNKRSKKIKKQSSSSYNRERKEDLVALKPLLQEEESKREDALVAKVQQCKRMFDFSEATLDVRNKEVKRGALIDIVDFLMTQKSRVVTERTVREIVDCARINMFRDMNPGQDSEMELDEDEPILEESWPHLCSVYEMLLKLIEHPEFEPKVAKKYIDQPFIQELLRILNSTDTREREMIKTILHRIYGRFLGHRAFIRKAIGHTFLAFTFENLIYRGVSELLEILSSIINGFALPLKQEHVDFLNKVLIPLHRSYYLTLYIDNLTTCIEQYIEKDPELTPDIVFGMFRVWPKTNSPKELAMLTEIEELIEKLGTREFEDEQNRQDIFRKFMKPFHQKMMKCATSTNFQVAEKALCMWNNDAFLTFFEQNNSELFPVVLPPLYASSKSHWNTQIAKLMTQILRAFVDINNSKYEEVMEQIRENEKQQRSSFEKSAAGATKRFSVINNKTLTGSAALAQQLLARSASIVNSSVSETSKQTNQNLEKPRSASAPKLNVASNGEKSATGTSSAPQKTPNGSNDSKTRSGTQLTRSVSLGNVKPATNSDKS